MKKLLQPWKIVIVLMFLMIFTSLFVFIYTEQVKLPSDNWSNQFEIDSYNPKMDFESLSANNTLAIATSETEFVNIVALDNSLLLKTFTIQGTLQRENRIDFDVTLSEVTGVFNKGKLELITLADDESTFYFVTVDPATLEREDSDSVVLEDMKYKLSNDHVTAYSNDQVAYVKAGEVEYFTPQFSGRIELAEADVVDGKTIISAITMKGSTYHLSLMIQSGDDLFSESLFILPSLSAINPINVTMAVDGDEAIIISTMKHVRFGNNYVDFFTVNTKAPEEFQHNGYEVDTYQAIPYLIREDDGQLSYLINFWASNLGRTEIAKGIQAYPNLYKTTHGTDEFKQLTKSERSSVKPSYLRMGKYDYLIHNEQNDLENKVFISSNDPKLIAMSRDYSQETLFDIFMRTITTYPALILAGIPPMMTVILPVLVIAAPILMFKLNWAEQNKEKMTAIILLTFLASKVYTFGFDIFPFFAEEGAWPKYLEAGPSHWGALGLFSALTFFVYWNRKSSRSGMNDHFLKSLSFYIILDLVIMISFFMPYSII